MLSAAFLDWWFAPWNYATSAHASQATDLVGRRDAYRLWCADAGVRPALPPAFDPGWQVAALDNGEVLTFGARLFGGLLAARHRQDAALAQLALAERRWCMSIASVQPLTEAAAAAAGSDENLEVRGLVELSWRLEDAFPGMWSRLRLLLPHDLDAKVAKPLQQAGASGRIQEAAGFASQRVLRCWRMCQRRADETLRANQSMLSDEVNEQ